jgi:DNA invertase Pin-like site-specific DNA recombinase
MKKVIARSRTTSKVRRVGYVRVSTLDQNENRQLEGIKLDRTFLDKASGKDVKRPQLAAMLALVREGDSVICESMGRLGRNLDDLGARPHRARRTSPVRKGEPDL